MRSVSNYPSSAYKNVRIVNNKICSIIKKDFDVNLIDHEVTKEDVEFNLPKILRKSS